MDNIIIVTTGASYLDIDAYACCISLTELIKEHGFRSLAYSSAIPNYSISNRILELGKKIYNFIPVNIDLKDASFIVVDVSDPDFIDPLVVPERICSIYDHHVGFEMYWADLLGTNSHIEYVGAATTLIFEAWDCCGILHKLSSQTAKIMVSGILDNTLNLLASITTDRDVRAKNILCDLAGIDEFWEMSYFEEQQCFIESNLYQSIKNDIKFIKNSKILPPVIGQVAIWDGTNILNNKRLIYNIMNSIAEQWLLNIIEIKNNCSYFICNEKECQKKIEQVFLVHFEGNIGITKNMWLRKEILKQAIAFEML